MKLTCVSARAKTLNNDDEFDHLIKHALACTLENDFEDVSNGSELRFGMIHELLNVGRLRLSLRGEEPCREQGKAWEVLGSIKAITENKAKGLKGCCSFEHFTGSFEQPSLQ